MRGYCLVMAVLGRDEDTVVAESAATIVSRLDQRMAELTGSIQQILVTEIAELRGDTQLLQLLRDSVDGNVATVFSAIRHAIPIEKVELPTAAHATSARVSTVGSVCGEGERTSRNNFQSRRRCRL